MLAHGGTCIIFLYMPKILVIFLKMTEIALQTACGTHTVHIHLQRQITSMSCWSIL